MVSGGRGRVLVGGTVLAAVVLAAVGGWLLLRDDDEADGADAPVPASGTGEDPFAERPADEVEVAPGSPEEAAAAFLDAEVAGDLETSFQYLAADDRGEQDSPAGWEETHADLWLPTGYRLTGVDEGEAGQATATAEVDFEPAIDQFLGVIPARATLDLPLVEEDGAWRVAFAESTYTPAYPDDAGAAEAVRTWAEAKARCETEAEWDGGLLDSPYLADRLCEAETVGEVGEPDTLDALADAGPYLDDFGDPAGDWARVVPIRGEVELDAVAAPLGDRWMVIGVSPSEVPLG